MSLTLDALNAASPDEFATLLAGIYEHSPWVVQRAASRRPFASLAALKQALIAVVREAGEDEQLALLRAHPELAGKAVVRQALTAESASEQASAGLAHCSPEEFARLQQLNADYNARFGWPFILAVRGPRGTGLSRRQIIDTFERRLAAPHEAERAECLRQVHRIAELRLAERFGHTPAHGEQVWDWCEALAAHSDAGFKERGELTVTYLTEAHQSCSRQIQWWMKECGFDEVGVDAVGNVVAVYHADSAARPPGRPPLPLAGEGWGEGTAAAQGRPDMNRRGPHPDPLPGGEGEMRAARMPPRLLTGSHFDTVRRGGRYDGRLGIFVPMVCVRELHRRGRRLPFAIEVVAFAEEEGQRYKASFLGSGALVGSFDPAWLEQTDADGVAMREAMQAAGLPGTPQAIAALRRDPAHYLGFVEVHIEQGPVLAGMDLPLGVVTSINGSLRYLGEVTGQASHAGTTPMNRRRDAAAAVAELALHAEARAARDGDSVATMGLLEVPDGSINVVPGRCRFSLDLRAPDDAQRDALAADVRAELGRICERRGVSATLELTMRAAAAPSAPAWQARWERAVAALGLPVHRLPSGAGHDAMKLHECMPQAMLFVRGENAGISHNPLESTTADDMQLAVDAFAHLLDELARDRP